MIQPLHESKARLLAATLRVVRVRGYTATRIEDVCAEAGLTKGSFFHHFKSKEDLALAAVAHWEDYTRAFFAGAPYHRLADPLERLLAYVDFRKSILTGDLPEFTCLLGTLVQEAYETHPAIREACDKYISAHAALVEADIAAAKRIYAPKAKWSPASLALFTQAALQGAFILAKAKHGPQIAADCIDHLQRYIETQLPPTKT